MNHFAHDRIVHIWWAESVLADLIRKYGDKNSKIFVIYSDKSHFQVDNHFYPIITALPIRINNLFIKKEWCIYGSKVRNRFFDYRNLMPLYPILCRLLRKKIEKTFSISEHENWKLIISSFATVKNILPINSKQTLKTILYLHSPMQYIWENYEEYVQKLQWIKKRIFIIVSKYLRARDKKPRMYDEVFYNSFYTKSCARQLYKRDEAYANWKQTVEYPKIDTLLFSEKVAKVHEIGNYYVYVGRLVCFIRETDRIIELANSVGFQLLILWDGPDKEILQSMAWDNVIFLWHIQDNKTKRDIIKKSKWLINLAKESCGLATMEALIVWVPVFGYNAWGSTELVWANMGLLSASKDLKTLIETFKIFENQERDRTTIKEEMIKKIKEMNQ